MRADLKSCSFCHGKGAVDLTMEEIIVSPDRHVEAVVWTVFRSGQPWVYPRCTTHAIDDWSNPIFRPATLDEIYVLEIMIS